MAAGHHSLSRYLSGRTFVRRSQRRHPKAATNEMLYRPHLKRPEFPFSLRSVLYPRCQRAISSVESTLECPHGSIIYIFSSYWPYLITTAPVVDNRGIDGNTSQ
jgi:hypothetical protein